MTRNSELIGVWVSEDHVFDSGPDRRLVIGTVRLLDGKFAKVKGYAAQGELVDGITYRLFGHMKDHHKHGPQFNFNSFTEEDPCDEESVISYLKSSCRSKERGSITERVARALFEKFGFEAIERVKTDPVGVSQAISRWEPEKALAASQYLKSQAHVQKTKLELIKLIDGRGFPKKTVDRAIKKWGAAAPEKIRKDPYVLMDFPGIGFKSADKMYCEVAREKAQSDEEYQEALAAIHRQGLCLCHAVQVESRSSGSTWVPAGFAKSAVTRAVGGVRSSPDDALTWAKQSGFVVVRDEYVATSRMALHELEIAEFISQKRGKHKNWPSVSLIESMAPSGKSLSQHQLDAINNALVSHVCCLQGSPGVGKTFAVACIVKALVSMFGDSAVAVAAPTGKAAVRVAQSMGANGVTVPASTIHRLLGVAGETGDDSGWSFHHGEQNPLPFRFIILDESSMIDVDLMASLLRACTPETHILFVGDVNQLAPVGHGRPFYDLQQVIPTGHLREIVRNDGRIVLACAEIRDKQTITFSPSLDIDNGENLPLVQADGPDQVAAMENLIRSLHSDTGDLTEEVQVLTAKNNGSPVSRKPMNQLLQNLINPDGVSVKGNPFRVGDKIVCLKNGYYQDAWDKHESHFVANGELGRVMELSPGIMRVRLSDPQRTILVLHAPVRENEIESADSEDTQRGAVGDWDLGYCLSVHRSQGSQWRFVIALVDKAGAMVQSRNWIYTAISRAEVATFIVGLRQTVMQSLKKDGITGRKTFLVERIGMQRLMKTVNYEELFAEVET